MIRLTVAIKLGPSAASGEQRDEAWKIKAAFGGLTPQNLAQGRDHAIDVLIRHAGI